MLAVGTRLGREEEEVGEEEETDAIVLRPRGPPLSIPITAPSRSNCMARAAMPGCPGGSREAIAQAGGQAGGPIPVFPQT